MSVISALAKAVVASGVTGVVWFEDDLPNKDKTYPQMCMDARFGITWENKEEYHEDTMVYISLWYQLGSITRAAQADDIALEVIRAVDKTVTDDVYITALGRDLVQEDDTGLARWRIKFTLTPLR